MDIDKDTRTYAVQEQESERDYLRVSFVSLRASSSSSQKTCHSRYAAATAAAAAMGQTVVRSRDKAVDCHA